MTPQQKLLRLKKILLKMDSCLVAFSGGADSSFLLKVSCDALPKDKLLAVTANSATYPQEELLFAKKVARGLGVRHKIIRTDELKDKRFVSNPVNRCYFCKSELFSRLKKMASENKLKFVADASNLSDKSDFRPGRLAKNKLKIRSPLQEAGFTKNDIRNLSRRIGLATWDKPALACLASRIPYGRNISGSLLKRINRAEVFIKKMGFKQVRVRDYGSYCRIEVSKADVRRLLNKHNQIIDKFKKLGYNYAAIDSEGYRTGSLNKGLKR